MYQRCLPTSWFQCWGLHCFQEMSPTLLMEWGWKTLSTVVEAMSQLSCLGKRRRGHSGLLSISWAVSLGGRGQELPLPLDMNYSTPFLALALLWTHFAARAELCHAVTRNFHRSFYSYGSGRHSPQWVDYDSAPCQLWGHQGQS